MHSLVDLAFRPAGFNEAACEAAQRPGGHLRRLLLQKISLSEWQH